jgi:hypothetical protein
MKKRISCQVGEESCLLGRTLLLAQHITLVVKVILNFDRPAGLILGLHPGLAIGALDSLSRRLSLLGLISILCSAISETRTMCFQFLDSSSTHECLQGVRGILDNFCHSPLWICQIVQSSLRA